MGQEGGGRSPTLGPWTQGASPWSPSASCHHGAWQGEQSPRTRVYRTESRVQLPGNNQCCIFYMIRTFLKAHPSINLQTEWEAPGKGLREHSSLPCHEEFYFCPLPLEASLHNRPVWRDLPSLLFPFLTTAEIRCGRTWIASRQRRFTWQINTVCGSNQSQQDASPTSSPDYFKAWAELSMNCTRKMCAKSKDKTPPPAWHRGDAEVFCVHSHRSWIFDPQGGLASMALDSVFSFSNVTLLHSCFRDWMSTESC